MCFKILNFKIENETDISNLIYNLKRFSSYYLNGFSMIIYRTKYIHFNFLFHYGKTTHQKYLYLGSQSFLCLFQLNNVEKTIYWNQFSTKSLALTYIPLNNKRLHGLNSFCSVYLFYKMYFRITVTYFNVKRFQAANQMESFKILFSVLNLFYFYDKIKSTITTLA